MLPRNQPDRIRIVFDDHRLVAFRDRSAIGTLLTGGLGTITSSRLQAH